MRGISSIVKKFKLRSVVAVLALAVGVSFLGSAKLSALSGSEFNAGRIIDDSVFFASNSMSVNEIQSFLNSKVTCDTNGQKMVGGITRAQYAAQRGYPTTFTCLPQYKENPSTRENNIGAPNSTPAGSISAAQIIYNVSAEHGVSAKALIVLLQKEQGLVTDEWPVPRQYQIATGYGCPDTAPCDEQYYGFYNQVNKAAYQFKRYVNNPGGYRYKANQVNSIYWSPTTSCGSSSVYIENGATAALYNYTPYRPNQAALDNLYGTGDGCSAYGNRNFWRMWRDWFGNVYTDRNQLTFYTHSGDVNVTAGGTGSAFIMYKNTGNVPLYDSVSTPGLNRGMVNLATSNPMNRRSSFGTSSWGPDRNRPAIKFSNVYESNGTTLAANQNVAQPGQIVKYSLSFSIPSNTQAGTYQEWIQPVRDGEYNWDVGGLAWLKINVQ